MRRKAKQLVVEHANGTEILQPADAVAARQEVAPTPAPPKTYTHVRCGTATAPDASVMVALVRYGPESYRGLFCAYCRRNFLVDQFRW